MKCRALVIEKILNKMVLGRGWGRQVTSSHTSLADSALQLPAEHLLQDEGETEISLLNI